MCIYLVVLFKCRLTTKARGKVGRHSTANAHLGPS